MLARLVKRCAALVFLANVTAHPVLASDCSSESSLKSAAGGTATDIYFHNGSSEQRRIYWLDENGQRKLKTIAEAGQTQRESTIAGHSWVITDAAEKCLYVITAASAPITAEIGSAQGAASPPATAQTQTQPPAPPAPSGSMVARLGLSGWYQLSALSKPGRALNNLENGKPEIERVKNEWESAYWEFSDAPTPGYLVITNKWTRKNLAAGSDGLHTVVGAQPGQGAQWTLESVDSGLYVRIKSRFKAAYLATTPNGFEFIEQPGPGNSALWQLTRTSQPATADDEREPEKKPKRASRDEDEDRAPTKKSRNCPRGERFDPDRLDCVSIKCGRHQVYSKAEGQCLDKADTCSRHEVYSSSMQGCIPKAAMCEKNQVYSSSVGACIAKSQPKPPPQPKPQPQPKAPKCAYKTDGVGNCLTPQFLSCQNAYGACMKACGNKAGKCEANCHDKYASICGD